MICIVTNRVTFVAFIFIEEPENSWKFTKQRLEDKGKLVT